DDWPLDVIRAQTVRTTEPRTCARGRDQRISAEPRTTSHNRNALGFLAFRVAEVRIAIESEQRTNLRIRPLRQQLHPPSEHRGGEPHRADRVPDVVLTVAEGAFAVLPCLAPDDRGQRDEKTTTIFIVERTSLFERMRARRVVTDAAVVHDPRFGRMQVAARGIHTQRP